MDDLQKITNFLKKKYNPEAILLCGSRAGDYYQAESDWDVILFIKKELSIRRTVDYIDNKLIDVEFRKALFRADDILSASLSPIRDVKILFDRTSGDIDALIQRTKKAYENGPEKMSQAKYIARRNYLEKKLNKFVSTWENPLLFNYYFGQYYHYVILTWFDLKRKWPLRIAQAIYYIKEKDPAFYTLLEKMAGEITYPEKINAAKQIYSNLFEKSSL